MYDGNDLGDMRKNDNKCTICEHSIQCVANIWNICKTATFK